MMAHKWFHKKLQNACTRKYIDLSDHQAYLLQLSTRAEVLENNRTASLRIHLERAIRRIREFEYLKLHSVVNYNLIGYFLDLVKVACALFSSESN